MPIEHKTNPLLTRCGSALFPPYSPSLSLPLKPPAEIQRRDARVFFERRAEILQVFILHSHDGLLDAGRFKDQQALGLPHAAVDHVLLDAEARALPEFPFQIAGVDNQ